MKPLKSEKLFLVSYEAELQATKKLIEQVKGSGFIQSDTVLVNCGPDYSSRVSQMLNHKLSYLNSNELFERLDLEVPFSNMSQIWNAQEEEYQLFDRYLANWIRKNVKTTGSYLFIKSACLTGRTMLKVRALMNARAAEFRFATLFVEEDSKLIPDYFTEKYSKETKGRLLFEWENSDNKNWL